MRGATPGRSEPEGAARRPRAGRARSTRRTRWRSQRRGARSTSSARRCSAGAAPTRATCCARARELLEPSSQRPSLRRVINATGVIVHTNLGRAPLAGGRARGGARAPPTATRNLELDLDAGERGSRHDHVEGLLRELTGAEAAIVVNNGAGAVLLAAAALAGAGRGDRRLARAAGRDRRRLPDPRGDRAVRRAAGRGRDHQPHPPERLRARARADDDVGAILRVHQSNFRTVGFVEDVAIEALCGLGRAGDRRRRLGRARRCERDPGARRRAVDRSARSRPARRSCAARATSCSADRRPACSSARRDAVGGRARASAGAGAADRQALARRARGDAARCTATRERARREIPVLAMLDGRARSCSARARAARPRRSASGATIVARGGKVGGGALPLLELEGPAVALDGRRDPSSSPRRCAASEPPVIARIHDGRVLLDPRTLTDDEVRRGRAPSARRSRSA